MKNQFDSVFKERSRFRRFNKRFLTKPCKCKGGGFLEPTFSLKKRLKSGFLQKGVKNVKIS